MLKFYKKLSPDNPVILANKARCDFTTLDNRTGYFAVDDAYVQSEFERLMGGQRYGLSEITAEEFTQEYVQKKPNSTPLRPRWREEIGNSSRPTLLPTDPEAAPAVALVGSDIKQKAPIVAVSDPPTEKGTDEDFKRAGLPKWEPKLSKRPPKTGIGDK